jgi:hypothetical protein
MMKQVFAAVLLVVLPALAQPPAGAPKPPGAKPAAAKPSAGPFTRLRSGEPNMQGYWETRNFFSAFDLETHEKATFEVPAGRGVVVDPPDGRIPYQAWALAKRKDLIENHPYDDPQAHCTLSGVPRQIYTPFGFQILQPQGYVLLIFEAFHAYRIIPLNGGPHIPASIKLFEGDSRGHWEGDTLVVDVTNQEDRTWFDMSANFHSDAIHVVERFTPVDAGTIRYEATIDDPKVFTRPWKIAFDLGRNREPNYEQMEYACVEGERDLQHYTAAEGGKARK